jgi:hypothetical protein
MSKTLDKTTVTSSNIPLLKIAVDRLAFGKTSLKPARFLGLLILMVSLAFGMTSKAMDSTPLYPPAPGHENLPVIFWAHYMPMVSYGFLHCSNHAGGNIDVFPFHTQSGSAEEKLYKAMISALASGINGFQFLTSVPDEAFAAAARVQQETGQLFYVALEGCGMGNDVGKAAKRLATFANKHKNNPHLFAIDGKPVVFFYSQGKWSGPGGTQVSTGVPELRKQMKDQGAELVLIPTVGSFVKVLLDRSDMMYRPFAPFKKADYGSGQWLRETNWDGITSLNGGANARGNQVTAIKKLLAESDKPFTLVPSIRSMYDSSNRWWQAIHCRGLGVRVIRRDLKQWLEAGFRLFTFSTWNDMMETMLMPSTRNPWGLNDMIHYYHSLAETGGSPFDTPRFIVSYEPEVLLGDQGFFQFLVLPEKDCHSSDYVMNVVMRSIDGKELLSFGNLAQVDQEIHDDLAEARYETSGIQDKHMLMVPYVTIKQIDKSSGASRVVYDKVRLAPIQIRYNKLHYHVPYTISMNHVDTDTADLELTWKEDAQTVANAAVGDIETVTLQTKGNGDFRRVTLSESCLSVGAFRSDDLAGQEKSAFFIRLDTSEKIRCVLEVKGGTVDSVYHAHWNLSKALKTFNKKRAYFDISREHRLPTVARVKGKEDSQISLRLAGMNKPLLSMTLRKLAEQPVRTSVSIGGKQIVVDVRLTTDATDANIDYPLPASGTYARNLPVQKGHGAQRIFHAWSLGKNNTISYSNPIILVDNDYATLRKVNYIRTGGVFDDFVDDSSSAAQNPFTANDVRTASLPLSMVPYSLIDFNEGCGTDVNHNGTAMQLGRGWLGGDCQWVTDGWEGAALQINDGTLNLRSKTMPHGSMTVSMRVKFEDPAQERALFEDADNWQMKLSGPLSLRIDKSGRVIAHRVCSGKDALVKSSHQLTKGWNHLAVTYDLKTLCLYINGKRDAVAANIKPAYQRTHSAPKIGKSKLGKASVGETLTFSGTIDQLEIIGAALSVDEIHQLYSNGSWLNQGEQK